MEKILFIFACATLGLASAYWGPDLPSGPFCGTNRQCCSDRRDDCSHKILGTLCYCDDFCNRTRVHDDCCPDYLPVCKGVAPSPIVKPCTLRGKPYLPGETVMDDCNACRCEKIPQSDPAATPLTEPVCEHDPCLISREVIDGVNRPGNSWRATNYTQFHGKKLKQALVYKLGTLPLDPETSNVGAIVYNKKMTYPTEFDARKKWPHYISPIVDQGWCGSDWAVSIAGVASDRFAIQSNGAENLMLSPQSFLSCNLRGQQGCEGGHIDNAWNFAFRHGIVDNDCLPYEARVSRCPSRKDSTLQQDGCRPPVRQRTSRYRVSPPGRLRREEDIMYDIMDSGPVQAIMTVYQDFFHYRDGVYRRTQYGRGDMKGLHSVRVVGWGEDRGDKYWIVANSWGTEWGENGYFRIARGENQSGIEWFVVTALAEVTESYMRK